MVGAEFRRIPYVDSSFALVIRNYGQSIARNVVVSFKPPIPDPEDPSTSVTPYLKRRYSGPIPTMLPGMELENIYLTRDKPGGQNLEPTPEQVLVTIEYHGPDRHRYRDDYPLDTELLKGHTYISSSAAPDALAKEAVKTLKHIHQALKDKRRRSVQEEGG